jgi:Cys-rich protein (TIGR01571 family)
MKIPTLFNDNAQFSPALLVFILLVILRYIIQYLLDAVLAGVVFGNDPNIVFVQGMSQVSTALLGILFAYLLYELRKKFRAKLQIPGDDCQDFICGWCCSCCVLAQMDRHLPISEANCNCSDPGPHPQLANLGQVIQPGQAV